MNQQNNQHAYDLQFTILNSCKLTYLNGKIKKQNPLG